MEHRSFALLFAVVSISVARQTAAKAAACEEDIASGPTVICDSNASGADMSRKLQSCMDTLPNGGTVDATSFTGTQEFSEDPFARVAATAPMVLKLGNVSITYAAKMTLPNHSSIMGNGYAVTLLRQKEGTSLAVSMAPKTAPASDIKLKGFTLDLNGPENAGPGQLSAIALGEIDDACVIGISVTNFYGKHCDKGCTGVALSIGAGKHVIVDSSRFTKLGAVPNQNPSDHQADAVYATGQDITITHNYFDGITDTAIVAENARDVEILSNEIHNSVQGIAASAPRKDWFTTNVRIAANDLYGMLDSNGQGIYVLGTDCSPSTTCPHGKTVDFIEIENNRIISPLAGGGIVIDHGYDITLLGNLVDWAPGIRPGGAYDKDGTGILVKSTRASLISSNVVDSAPSDGINLTNSDTTSIVNNTSQFSGRRGYLLQEVHDLWLENNRAFSNDQSEQGAGAGFWLDTTVRPSAVTFKGNHATGSTQGRGLTVVRGSDVNIIANNLLHNASNPSLSVFPSATVSVTGNYHFDQWPVALSDVVCVGATGANKSYFTNVDCAGTEVFYVPDGGQCQPHSATGAVCGTTQGRYTVRSYRTATGSCHNQWPGEGTGINAAVRVFR